VVFGHLDRLAEALETFLRGEALGAQPLRLAGLFEDRAAFGEIAVRGGPTVAGAGQGVAIVFQLVQGELALLDGGLGPSDRLFGELEAAWVLGPFRVQVVEGPLEGPLRP